MSDGPTPPNAPDFGELEQWIVEEVHAGLVELGAQATEPLSVVVVWSDPYKGWYELLADTQARNEEGARKRNAETATTLGSIAAQPDAWMTAQSTSRALRALPFDPRYGDYAFGEDPVHSFEIGYDEFLRSPDYAALNVGGEDGWLEGHVRFVLAKALLRLAAEGAFDALPRAPLLRVGYAYPDSSDALIVTHVTNDLLLEP